MWGQYRRNQVFVDLIGYARGRGNAELLRWWHAIDANLWLASRGVTDPDCDGSASGSTTARR